MERSCKYPGPQVSCVQTAIYGGAKPRTAPHWARSGAGPTKLWGQIFGNWLPKLAPEPEPSCVQTTLFWLEPAGSGASPGIGPSSERTLCRSPAGWFTFVFVVGDSFVGHVSTCLGCSLRFDCVAVCAFYVDRETKLNRNGLNSVEVPVRLSTADIITSQ